MKRLVRVASVAITIGLATVQVLAEPVGAVFPGNEAVRIVDGKRVVEAPPLTKGAQAFLKAGNKFPPPTSNGGAFMVEGADGLMECSSGALSDTGCIQPTLGKTKVRRFWTVKLNGVWLYCPSREPSKKCEPTSAGAPGGMPSPE